MQQDTFTPRILVIDDEEIIRTGLKRLLSKHNYEVILAENGLIGLQTLKREPIHVVLLDIKMPEMEGMEVLKNIVRSKLDPTVIIITGYGTIEDAVAAIKMGAYDFITKPFMPDHLLQVVGRAIERRRLKQERDHLRKERERGLWTIVTEKSRLKAVINSMNEGVLITERDKRIVMCNPALTNLINMDHSCIIGSIINETPELQPLDEMADKLLKDVDKLTAITQEIVINKDHPTYLRASVNNIQDERGEALGLVIVLEDVTHFKELEQRKSEFVSMVTHELRAPLGTVDTQFNVVLRGLAGSITEKQQEMFLRMKERIGGVLEMITNLLDLSKIEAHSFIQQKKAIDITPIIRESCKMLEDQARDKGLTFTVNLMPELPRIMADPSSMEQVLINLLSNAIRYTPPQGHIEVSSGVDADYIQFAVADTGIGIEKKDLDKIFDRFYRVKSERTRSIVGTGLGLPIAKAIVEDHLGFIRVESEPDKGSIFKVLLPIMI